MYCKKNYKYIILTRSDFLHLCPFPDVSSLIDKKLDKRYKDLHFWCYNGHEWGGINLTLVCVPSAYIKKYLYSFYNFLQLPTNIVSLSKSYNVEYFAKVLFNENKWRIGKIEPNAFITASNLNEITTWGKVYYSSEYKLFFKYKDQMLRAINCSNKYQTSKKWHLCELKGIFNIIILHP